MFLIINLHIKAEPSVWVAETDPRSQSGCWQRFRESRENREAGGERKKEKTNWGTERRKEWGEIKRETMKGRNRDEIKMCQRKSAVNDTFCIHVTHWWECFLFPETFFFKCCLCVFLSVCSLVSLNGGYGCKDRNIC